MTTADAPLEERLEAYLRRRRYARECALQFLYQADQQDDWDCAQSRLELLRQQLDGLDSSLPDAEAGRAWEFAERLIRGVCAERQALDALIGESALNWTLARMAVVDRNILRLAAFELLHCDDVPDVASVDEAVELAKEFGHKDSHRFVNGILDRLLHQCRVEPNASADEPPSEESATVEK